MESKPLHTKGPWVAPLKAGPSTHIGWTPDHEKNPPRVVLITHDDLKRMRDASADMFEALEALCTEAERAGIALSNLGQGATNLGLAMHRGRKALAKARGQ